MEDTHKSQFGKMFMVLIQRQRERTSEQSLKLSGKSANQTIAFLDMRQTAKESNDGRESGASWEIIPLSLGEDLTLNFGESPKDASVCSLSSILEDNVPDKYFLSEKACQGILRRSDERGKPLHPLLKQALYNTISFMRWKTTLKTEELPSVPITSSKPSPDEWVQGGGNVPLILCKATPQANAEVCENLAPTLSAAAGMSGNNQPIVTVPAFGFQQNASGRNAPLIAVPVSFGQTAYDDYEPTEQAVTLKASGGNYGGGKRDVDTAIGVDFYNCSLTGGQTMTMSSARSDPHHLPCALIPYTLKIRSGCEGGVREL